MITKKALSEDISELKALWKEAFGDTDEFTDRFFAHGFSQKRSLVLKEGKEIASALYWFDCEFQERKIAYVYGVATKKKFRGRGFASELMKSSHDLLRDEGYSAIILVPAEDRLFYFYEKLGYIPCAHIDEGTVSASEKHTDFRKVNVCEYFTERKKYLPEFSVTQTNDCFDFLSTLSDFYIGEDFIVSLRKETQSLFANEFLGNFESLPSFIYSMGYKSGTVRTQGMDSAFAMYFPLTNQLRPRPEYLGFAFD